MPQEIKWSRWTPYESSFSLALLPHSPGVFAVAEEVLSAAGDGKRMIALIAVSEAGDLAYMLGHLHQTNPDIQKRMNGARLYVRFAVVEEVADRREVVTALQSWMRESAQTASGIIENFSTPASPLNNYDQLDSDKEAALGSPVFPAGF